MSQTFYKELNLLARTKKLINLLPGRVRFRVAKRLYNYEADSTHGIDLVAPLQQEGLVCFINTKDLIGWKIFFFGEYEQDTNSILAKYLKDTDVVIEAGANIGSETLLISQLVKRGHVYAFEPNPYTYERLKINAEINKLTNVTTSDVALGEKNGAIQFNIFPKDFCNSGMSSKYMETAKSIKIDVVQKTLDSYVAENNITKVDFIKMDIQGAEMDLLIGAENTIKKFRPAIFTEACEPYNNTKDLYKKIKDWKYNIHLIKPDKIESMQSVSDVKDGNWIAFHESVS